MIKLAKYLLLLFAAIPAYSQSIKLVRTDVDSARTGIITATFVFGVDIQIDSLPNCSSVAFLLKYTNPDIVKFSGFRNRDFETTGVSAINVPTNPTEDVVLNEASMNISVYSGLKPGINKFNSPNVLHLEFVVLQNALANQNVTFSFEKATAIGFDSVAKEVKLTSIKHIYKVHSFVDVYPGDANNDKIVNTDDYSTIGLYMRKGADDRESRTFKRQNASTQWYAQRVLTWDVAAATYADCDGDGTVTVVDGLVVKLNDGKTGTIANGGKNNAIQSQNADYYNFEPRNSNNTVLIPINIAERMESIAYIGKIDLSAYPDYTFAGISKGLAFNGIATNTLVDFNEQENKVEFFIASNGKSEANGNNIAYLLLEPKATNSNDKLAFAGSITGYNNAGQQTKLLTDIAENESIYTFEDRADAIVINSKDYASYTIFASSGLTMLNGSLANSTSIAKNKFDNGVYFVQIQSGISTQTYKFIVAK